MIWWTAVKFFLKDHWQVIIGGVVGVCIALFVWSWDARGKKIDSLKDDITTLQQELKNKQAVIDLMNKRQLREVEINNETNERLEHLEQVVPDNGTPMSPALRTAIDSLY